MKIEIAGNHAQNPHNSPIDAQGANSVYCVQGLGGIEKLFSDLRSAGVVLSIDRDGRLEFDGPDNVLTDDRLAIMRAHRDGLLALVASVENKQVPEASAGRVVHCKRSAFDVYIGRPGKGHPGPWGNPFEIGRDGTRAEVIRKYRSWIVNQKGLMAMLPELRGKVLGCYCAPLACHGDVLLELLGADVVPVPVPVLDPVVSLSGVICPYCRSMAFEDVERGWQCCDCKRLAWIWLPGGSIVRADYEKTNLAFEP